MERRSIAGLSVSVIGLGCNNFGMRVDEASSIRVVHAAVDRGITLYDTADIYGGTRSEEFLGKALGARRDDVVVATKFGMPVEGDPQRSGGSAAWVARAVEDSLTRLGTDRIDLYQFHRPDPQTPIEETLGALDELVRAGKVRAIGHSNFSRDQIVEADRVAMDRGLTRFVCAQNHLNLLTPDAARDVLPTCRELGLAFLPYFPLASGVLTGKYRRGEAPPPGTRLASVPAERLDRLLNADTFDIVEGLGAFAADHGRTLTELAVAWLAGSEPVASVIAGATSVEQVDQNARAADWALSPDQRRQVEAIAGV